MPVPDTIDKHHSLQSFCCSEATSLPMWTHFLLFLMLCNLSSVFAAEDDQLLLDDEESNRSRSMASVGQRSTAPIKPRQQRSSYPQSDPHICLAFLSCCQRTDLLNHTLAGAIRHMEEDEPSFLRYEIAWVDNGSDKDKTSDIVESYQIEHALTLPQNMGLAYGMNLLINNLCTAPYILLLEEDWLYLDELVAPQTQERKRAIASSIALIENLTRNNITAYDRRKVMGVFLRHETYESFLRFPHMDNWERAEKVNIQKELPSSGSTQCSDDKNVDSTIADIDYRIFCGDTGMKYENIWGSYTNGAGLYKRADLMAIGRMYGEPGDAFHDRYIEGNYAYRVALGYCHAAIRLTDDASCKEIHNPNCAGAFHHIGGGRGTRPMNAKGTKCDDQAWNFFGTPMYSKYHKLAEEMTGKPVLKCSSEELRDLRDRKFRDTGKCRLVTPRVCSRISNQQLNGAM